MEDFINHIKAQMYDRARSPLFFSFSIAWVAWNIKLLIAIFSNDSINEKFKLIDSLYSQTNLHIFTYKFEISTYYLTGLVYPAVTCAIFITVYPYLAKFAFSHWNKQHIKIKELQTFQEDITPMSVIEVNKMKKDYIENLKKAHYENQDLIAKQVGYKDDIKSLENQLDKNKKEYDDLIAMQRQSQERVESLQSELIDTKTYVSELLDKTKLEKEKTKNLDLFAYKFNLDLSALTKNQIEIINRNAYFFTEIHKKLNIDDLKILLIISRNIDNKIKISDLEEKSKFDIAKLEKVISKLINEELIVIESYSQSIRATSNLRSVSKVQQLEKLSEVFEN